MDTNPRDGGFTAENERVFMDMVRLAQAAFLSDCMQMPSDIKHPSHQSLPLTYFAACLQNHPPRSVGMPTQVRIMATKMEEDYKKAVEKEQQQRAVDNLLQSLDKIRSPICVCEITQHTSKILFANHTWGFLAGE